MFELRKLALHQRPVSESSSKQTLEEYFSNRPQLAPYLAPAESNTVEPSGEHQPKAEAGVEPSEARDAGGEEEARGEGAATPQNLRPEEIMNDMQTLQERRLVHGILQGPVHEEIDRTLREGQRRPRPRVRQRPLQAEESEEGGDEMNQPPVGRLLAAGGQSRRQRGSRGRRVRFRYQVPTPNPDGRYAVPPRDQSGIVQRLRQSPALNSLGVEARDEIVAEVGSLVSQQLVTTALAGEFRGVLELHIQARAEHINDGHLSPPPAVRQQMYHQAGERNATPSAGVLELREDMVIMKGQLNELKQMMRASFDLQLDIQRAIRQEVSAALAAFISQPQLPPNPHSATASGSDKAVCQIPTLDIALHQSGVSSSGVDSKVVESGHCVICSEGTIDSVMYHCGHMCTCVACGLELKSKALKCPICRAPITDVIRAYASML